MRSIRRRSRSGSTGFQCIRPEASVDAQARFFVLPGAGHSGDGVSESTGQPIASSVDLVGMMLDWVERGVAPPEAPVLRAMQREAPHRITATRPMCRYPQYPAYLGGDAQRAEASAAPIRNPRRSGCCCRMAAAASMS